MFCHRKKSNRTIASHIQRCSNRQRWLSCSTRTPEPVTTEREDERSQKGIPFPTSYIARVASLSAGMRGVTIGRPPTYSGECRKKYNNILEASENSLAPSLRRRHGSVASLHGNRLTGCFRDEVVHRRPLRPSGCPSPLDSSGCRLRSKIHCRGVDVSAYSRASIRVKVPPPPTEHS